MADPVTIIGGGWAGLAAAVELSHNGIPVTILESAKSCGGRARKITYQDSSFDNGQHLMIGAYHETVGLLKICGIDPEQVFQRAPLNFTFYNKNGGNRNIRLPRIVAPIHMIVGIMTASGISWSTKRQLIMASLRFMLMGFKLKTDSSVADLLQQVAQDNDTIKALWEPLCIATLNTPTNTASANIFLQVLKDAFTRSCRDSDTLIPVSDLSALFVEPALRFINEHGGEVLTSSRVKSIEQSDNGSFKVITDTATLESINVILAIPPHQSVPLLSPHPQLSHLTEMLQQFTYQPIITLYLQYDRQAKLTQPFVGFDEALTDWLFDRSHNGQPGLMAAVISSEGEHSNWSRDKVTRHVIAEITARIPELGEPRKSWLIHEKRATFAATVGLNQHRPANRTKLGGLWLAGDYTDSGYPATVEGAVISGVAAANGIISQNIRK